MRVGCQLAGQRITLRADGSQMAVFDRAGCCCARCPARPARGRDGRRGGRRAAALSSGPAGPIAVQRRVSSRRGIQVVRQRIQVGVTVTVLAGDDTFRLVIDGETVAVASRAPAARSTVTRPTRPTAEGGNPMPEVRLNASDAAELAELPQFLSGWPRPWPPR